MIKIMRNTLLLASTMLALGGCSHAVLDQRINEKVAREPAINTRSELNAEVEKLIESTPGLSKEQKAGLLGLSTSTREQVNQILAASLKLRSVLVNDMIAKDYDEDEVEMIKDRLRDLEDKRVSVLFDAVDQANTILGRDARLHPEIVHAFVDGHRVGRSD